MRKLLDDQAQQWIILNPQWELSRNAHKSTSKIPAKCSQQLADMHNNAFYMLWVFLQVWHLGHLVTYLLATTYLMGQTPS